MSTGTGTDPRTGATAAAGGRVRHVHGRRVLPATTRAGRMPDVRGGGGLRPGQPGDAGRGVAVRSAGQRHEGHGEDDGRAVRPGRPAGRGVRRAPEGGGRGRRGGQGAVRAAGGRAQGAHRSGTAEHGAGRSENHGVRALQTAQGPQRLRRVRQRVSTGRTARPEGRGRRL